MVFLQGTKFCQDAANRLYVYLFCDMKTCSIKSLVYYYYLISLKVCHVILIFLFHLLLWMKEIIAVEAKTFFFFSLYFNAQRISPFWCSHCGGIIKQHWQHFLFVQRITKGYPVLRTTSFLIQVLQVHAVIPQMAALVCSEGQLMHSWWEEEREGKHHKVHPCITEKRQLPDSSSSGGIRWRRLSKGIMESYNQKRTMQGPGE